MYKKILMGIALAISMPLAMTAQADYVLTQQIGFEAADTYDEAGFDRDGVHQETQTSVDPDGYGAEGNQAPVINSFSASPDNGNAPLAVTFSATVSDDVGTPSLNINYGDGSSGSAMSHTYSAAGNYTATLTATDEKGVTATATASITANSADQCYFGFGANQWLTSESGHGIWLTWNGAAIATVSSNASPVTEYTVGGVTYTRGNIVHDLGDSDYYQICGPAQ